MTGQLARSDSRLTPFGRRVLSVVRRVPRGSVVTYGDVARLAGRRAAARAVGAVLRRSAEPGLPYHRVVAAGGRLGGSGGSPELKRRLLSAEGITVRRGRIVGFDRLRWRPTARSRPAGSGTAGRGKGNASAHFSVKF